MTLPSRAICAPVLLADPSRTQPLIPISLSEPPFREGRLQELLALHPELLPVGEIEPAFGPMICLGREIPTPSGYLTLVETKLWDNPEARREVVGQVLDYAKDFARWTFEDLDNAVRSGAREGGSPPPGVLDRVRQEDPGVDAAAFMDNVSRGLRRGRFLLLVAGNGIREDVESMVDYLQQSPGLHFSLALVELALYRLEAGKEWPLLVQPRTLARTVELTRAVVEVTTPAGIDVQVTIPKPEPTRGARPLTEATFYEQLISNTSAEVAAGVRRLIEDLGDAGVSPTWRVSGVSMRLPDPGGSGDDFTLIVLTQQGTGYLGWLNYISQYGEHAPEIAQRYLRRFVELTKARVTPSGDTTREVPVQTLLAQQDEYLASVRRLIDELRGEGVTL